MTVLEDRIAMADANTQRLDEWFERLERMPVAKLCDGAKRDESGHWRHQDVEFLAEVNSQGTAANDYGPKRLAYAAAEVPLYLIADPYQGRCHIFTHPKDGDYTIETRVAFGQDLDLTDTVLGLTLPTADFPRD
ncbi:Uma2 family endonuclease [Streptomyces sp. NPDC032940]|uniref:Uma2 family endonuclease n=1 Tax=Streptomyces sp. NPDC032940 TaxID=3155366 RepID=UPI003410C1A9